MTIQSARMTVGLGPWETIQKREFGEAKEFKKVLDSRGVHYERHWSWFKLSTTVKRSNHGLLCLSNCTREELLQFCYQRAADMAFKISDPDLYTKADLIKALEAADEDFLFERFFELPPELRTIIYESALLYYEDGEPSEIRPTYGPSCWTASEILWLTEVSSQVREEALPFFYSINTFSFEPEEAGERAKVKAWLDLIGPKRVQHIRRLEMGVKTSCDHWYMDDATLAIDLNGCKFELRCELGEGCKRKAEQDVRVAMMKVIDGKIRRVGDVPLVTSRAILKLLDAALTDDDHDDEDEADEEQEDDDEDDAEEGDDDAAADDQD